MKQIIVILLIFPLQVKSQTATYTDSLNHFIEQYVNTHEVVQGNDRMQLQFYPIDEQYRVQATFIPTDSSTWFWMSTSSAMKKECRLYGSLTFMLQDTALQLNVYQFKSMMLSKDYADYLFLPFTDNTNGFDSYGGGRYIDLKLGDISNAHCVLDFNKAYNPYCAYAAGYSCPIPPKENDLHISVQAGEKKYKKF
jgi:uncharacterized protein